MSFQEEQENLSSAPVETERENIDEKTSGGRRHFILTLVSNVLFLISSILYVCEAVVDLRWEENIKGIPAYVLEADDIYTWEPYYFGDDYVFKTPNSDVWVSKYQILYFSAALGFVLVGIVDCFNHSGFLGACMILAGCFGLGSAVLAEEDENLSLIFNIVSVHLYCIEAFALFYKHSFFGALKIVMRIADFFFIVGTLVDVVLSYLYWADRSNIRVARVAIFAACCWLATGIIYTGTTIYIHKNGGYDSSVANEGGKQAYGQNKNASQITDETEEGEDFPWLSSDIHMNGADDSKEISLDFSSILNEGGKELYGQNKNASQITDETGAVEDGQGIPSSRGDLGQMSYFCMDIEESSRALGQMSCFCMDIEESSRASF